MKKFVCSVCGYVHEGETAPDFCPICKAPKEKFVEQAGEKSWAAEHVVGVAQGAPEEILQGLRENFHTARATPRSACTGRRPPMRRPSTPPSSPSCWARW